MGVKGQKSLYSQYSLIARGRWTLSKQIMSGIDGYQEGKTRWERIVEEVKAYLRLEIRAGWAECSALKREEGPTLKVISRQERGWARDGEHDHHHHYSSLPTHPPPIKKIRLGTCTEPSRPGQRHASNPDRGEASDYEQRRDMIELIVLKYRYASSRWTLETKAKLPE